VNAQVQRVKYWEIIADNLSKAGWSYGYVSTVDSEGRTIWIADAYRDNGNVSLRADEQLTAFLEEPCAVVFNRAQKVTVLDECAALA
jgi:hypothetical protein